MSGRRDDAYCAPSSRWHSSDTSARDETSILTTQCTEQGSECMPSAIIVGGSRYFESMHLTLIPEIISRVWQIILCIYQYLHFYVLNFVFKYDRYDVYGTLHKYFWSEKTCILKKQSVFLHFSRMNNAQLSRKFQENKFLTIVDFSMIICEDFVPLSRLKLYMKFNFPS